MLVDDAWWWLDDGWWWVMFYTFHIPKSSIRILPSDPGKACFGIPDQQGSSNEGWKDSRIHLCFAPWDSCACQFGIWIFQDKIGRHGKDCWLGRGDGAGLAIAKKCHASSFCMDLIRWIPWIRCNRSTLFSPTRREPSPKMRWSLHIAAWGHHEQMNLQWKSINFPCQGEWINGLTLFDTKWHQGVSWKRRCSRSGRLPNESQVGREGGGNNKQVEVEKGLDFCEAFNGLHHFPTVDGQNPAPPRMMIIPLFIGF